MRELALSMRATSLLFLAVSPLGAVAAWGRKASTRSSLPSVDLLSQGLSSAEYKAIFGGNELLAHLESKPDCFKTAAADIRSRCGEEFEADSDERVRAAVRFTICEIATARQRAPMECDDISVESEPCVEALSRSSQHWSTYSGYLREVNQLCFAFRRSHDIDVARNIYANITKQKLALLNVFLDHSIKLREDLHHEHLATEALIQQTARGIQQMQASMKAAEIHLLHSQASLETFKSSLAEMLAASMASSQVELQGVLVNDMTSALRSHGASLEAALLAIVQHTTSDMQSSLSQDLTNAQEVILASQSTASAAVRADLQALSEQTHLAVEVASRSASVVDTIRDRLETHADSNERFAEQQRLANDRTEVALRTLASSVQESRSGDLGIGGLLAQLVLRSTGLSQGEGQEDEKYRDLLLQFLRPLTTYQIGRQLLVSTLTLFWHLVSWSLTACAVLYAVTTRLVGPLRYRLFNGKAQNVASSSKPSRTSDGEHFYSTSGADLECMRHGLPASSTWLNSSLGSVTPAPAFSNPVSQWNHRPRHRHQARYHRTHAVSGAI